MADMSMDNALEGPPSTVMPSGPKISDSPCGPARTGNRFPLDRLQVQVGDGHLAARQGGGGPEDQGAGGVGLDVGVAGMVALAAGDHQALIALPGEGDPKGVHTDKVMSTSGRDTSAPRDGHFHPLRRPGAR